MITSIIVYIMVLSNVVVDWTAANMTTFGLTSIRPNGSLETSLFVSDAEARKCMPDRKVIDRLQIDNQAVYNKHKVPFINGMTVDVQVVVQSISAISEITQDFVVDLYMHEFWNDPRLQFMDLKPCKTNISLDRELYEHLWTPNTCFINSKDAEIHESPFKNIFLMIYPDGYIWTFYRLQLTGPCDMRLENFPWDSQSCKLTFESFNYNIEEVKMRWIQPRPIKIKQSKRWLPDFYLSNITASREEVLYPAGWWDELTLTFYFKRRPGWYLMQAYIPTYLTIFISWISFYLGTKAIPARTMIGVNALLALTFQFGSILKNLPRVSYVKAIDVWMLVGMTFVFASLLELAVIGWLANKFDVRESRRRNRASTVSAPSHRSASTPPVQHILPGNKPPEMPQFSELLLCEDLSRNDMFDTNTKIEPDDSDLCTHRRRRCCGCLESSCTYSLRCRLGWCRAQPWMPERIDQFASVMFPTLFAIFNLFYWSYYLSRPDYVN